MDDRMTCEQRRARRYGLDPRNFSDPTAFNAAVIECERVSLSGVIPDPAATERNRRYTPSGQPRTDVEDSPNQYHRFFSKES